MTVRSVWSAAILIGAGQLFSPASVSAQMMPFAALLERIALMEDGDCRAGIVAHRIDTWQNGPPVVSAFESVEAIMAPMTNPVSRFEARGCNSEYLWSFLACTQLDVPDAPYIPQRGVTAETDAEFAQVLEICMTALDDAQIKPRP
jgi:hypothetical protein